MTAGRHVAADRRLDRFALCLHLISRVLRSDPAFKLACGRLPDSGRDLCSQPTMSRWENAPDLRSVIRLGRVSLDLWLASYPAPRAAVSLDIDDTCDVEEVNARPSMGSVGDAYGNAMCAIRRSSTTKSTPL